MNRTIRTDSRKVYVSTLRDYDKEQTAAVLTPLLDHLLGENAIDKGALAGKTVLLKPNLLAGREAEAGITTHPVFVSTCASYFRALGANVVIADSPGGVYNKMTLESIYKATGLKEAAEQSGATLNFDVTAEEIRRKDISPLAFHIITPILRADLVVNLARLKTHALCEISAAVKNLFGAIPGLQKPEQHARFPKRADFAAMLCDLCLVCAPQINIIDGVRGMEGNGPAGGTLRDVGVVLGSVNPFAADLAASFVMGFESDEVGTVRESVRRGLCPTSVKDLDLVGEELSSFAAKFKRPDGTVGGLLKQLPSMFGGRVQKFLEPRPTVDTHKCIGCGICAKNCPVSTIQIKDGKAHIESKACIKCYCCQEFCPIKAIKVKRFLGFNL